MKKVKHLRSLFMVLLLVCTMNVKADTISEDFKEIFNDSNAIKLTYNGVESKDSLIINYLEEFNNSGKEYYFYTDINDCTDDYTKCNIQKINVGTNDVEEEHIININYNEIYSDIFKSIINNGKVIVNESTLLDSKSEIINDTLSDYKKDNSYFEIDSDKGCNDDYSICNIVLYDSEGNQEKHKLPIEYKEEYSDEFNQFFKNGKITITESTLSSSINLVEEYISNIYNENYMIQLSNCNENNTKCDAIIYNYETSKQETHVVEIVKQELFSDEYNEFAKDGNLVITWTREGSDFELINNYLSSLNNENYYFSIQECNSDYSKCDGVLFRNQTNKQERHVVNIKYDEKYSDEFKKITTDGNIVITSTTTGEINNLIFDYVNSVGLNEGLNFRVEECSEDGNKCKIGLYKNYYKLIEKHILKIKYDEKYSEEFKKIATDGNIVITSSGNKQDILSQYANNFSTDSISYNINYCNDDYTVCTAIMNEIKDGILKNKEQHIVNIKYDEKYSEEFKKITTDGKLTVETITSDDFDSEFLLTAKVNDLIDTSKYIGYGYCNEDLVCNITIQSMDGKIESHNVEIIIKEPSKEIQEIVVNATKNMKPLNLNQESFDLRQGYILDDLYLINYFNSIRDIDDWNYYASSKALKFSKELIELTKGSNISFGIDLRAGDAIDLWDFAFGKAIVYYDGVAYATVDAAITQIHAIYISNDTKETKEAYIKAAQDRINNYFEKTDIEVSYGGLLDDLDEYNKEYGLIDYSKTDGNYYNIKIGEKDYSFIIVKAEQDLLENPTYLGSDIISNIFISSDDSEIPLDTTLNVKKLQNEEIEKAVKTNNYLAYDIKLYSDTKGVNITKLSNGKFKVSIPISEELNGKEVTTYYINENNELEEYETTVENGFATFETNHFSIYTLVEKKSSNNSNNNDINKGEEKNPETYDEIMIWYILGLISMSGIVGTIVYRKKQNI